MRNLKYKTLTADKYFEGTKKGLHSPNKEFVCDNESLITAAYSNYLNNASPCALERISPIWHIMDTDTEAVKIQKKQLRKQAHDLYDTKEVFKEQHKMTLNDLNGGMDIICPLCGIKTYHHLDHYIPREQMPEFSVFPPNLIPLCYDCNELKGTNWLNESHERIIFNAFFDELPDKPICDCVIRIDENNLPKAEIVLSSLLDEKDPLEKRILTTIETLHLISVWQKECDKSFKKALGHLKRWFKPNRYSDFEDYWSDICVDLEGDIKDSTISSFIEGVVYRSIVNSIEIKKWLLEYLSQSAQRKEDLGER